MEAREFFHLSTISVLILPAGYRISDRKDFLLNIAQEKPLIIRALLIDCLIEFQGFVSLLKAESRRACLL